MKYKINKQKIVDLILDIFDNEEYTAEMIDYVDLVDDWGMDSIAFITIIIEIESYYCITIPENLLTLDAFRNISDIVSIVETEISNIKQNNNFATN